jgi:hypothetical protein
MLQFISHLDSVVSGFAAGGSILTIAGFVEIILRLVPSQQPLSIAYAASDILHGVANLVKDAGDALDKVLPNRVKPAAASAAQAPSA